MKITLSILLFCLYESAYAQPKVKLEIIFSINDDKTTQKEYMFKHVTGIITDDENNFYVHENIGSEIRKFSKDGKYIKTIGRNGAGPGEIRTIYKMYISNQNEIVVHDPPNFRHTYFSLDGKYIKSIPIKPGTPDLGKVTRYQGNSYIALRRVNNDKLEHGNKIVIYDNSFQNLLTSFGHSSIFWKYNDVFELHMDVFNDLKIAAYQNIVFVSKKYYDGKIFIFDKNTNWDVKIVEGRQIKKPGYDVIEGVDSNFDWEKYPGASVGFSAKWEGITRNYAIVYRYTSAGIFVYKEKYLVNFLLTWKKKKEYEFGIDLYKIDGTYLGYTKIASNEKYYLQNQVFCQDKEDNFYMVTSGDIIKKIKLSID
ncbi:MAG: hypothetical protein C0412_06970 [Flavobacterium sp.]|nr:hypothetical protein [Flavobacterium sp.]